MYSGDIQQKGALFNPLKLAYGLGVRYQYRPKLGFALHAAGRGYKGTANHGGLPDALDEMNGKMWEHPATQRNVDLLKSDGCRFLGPEESGMLACGLLYWLCAAEF